MRWMPAVAVLTVMLGAAGCAAEPQVEASGSANPTPTPTVEADPVVGQWTGTWESEGSLGEAVLEVTTADPLTAAIEIVDLCTADWNELSREGGIIRVAATVTSGDCIDNEWDVTIDGDHLTTTDPENPTNMLDLTKR